MKQNQNTPLSDAVIATFDVDPQKGFTSLCPDELPVRGGHKIGNDLNYMATKGKYRIGSKDAHPQNPVWKATENLPMFTQLHYPNADLAWNLHCVVGTKGFEFLDELPDVNEYDLMVYKGMEPDLHPYGACFHDLEEKMSTGVIEYLKAHNVDVVIVGGLAYDHCVKVTATQLAKAGFTVYVYEVATAGIMPESCKDARVEMQEAGVIMIETKDDLDSMFM